LSKEEVEVTSVFLRKTSANVRKIRVLLGSGYKWVVNSRVAEIRKAGQAIEVQTLARYAEALGYDLEIAFVSKKGERLVAR
jgi:hypothetical protein